MNTQTFAPLLICKSISHGFASHRALTDSCRFIKRDTKCALLCGLSRCFTAEATLNDPIPAPDLGDVRFTKCPPDGTCLGQAKAVVFLRSANVGVGRDIVTHTSESTLLDLWLGALTASRLKGASSSAREKVIHQVEQWRLQMSRITVSQILPPMEDIMVGRIFAAILILSVQLSFAEMNRDE